MATETPVRELASPDELVERLFAAILGSFDLFSVYLGHRLGYYRALADVASATSTELATATGTAERYAREWLEQQAVTGILAVDDAPDPAARRFRLPAGYEAVLVDPDSLAAMAPLAQAIAGAVAPLPAIVQAYRSGDGVPFEAYGPDLVDGQAGSTRPIFRHLLTQEWMPHLPRVDARLRSDPAARIADIGSGAGRSSIALATAYPLVHVDGFDLDAASIAAARANAEAASVSDRVTFHLQDAADAERAGGYAFALAFECIHDMPNPVAVLGAMRRLVGPGGTVLIVDERVAETFSAPGDEIERLMYGFSILHCLPVGMVEQPSAATGTVMRASTLRRYCDEAGFTAFDILPVEHDFYRLYALTA